MRRIIFYQHAKTRNLLSQYDSTKVVLRTLADNKKPTSSLANLLGSFPSVKSASKSKGMTAEQLLLPKKLSQDRMPQTFKQAEEKRNLVSSQNSDDIPLEKALDRDALNAAEKVAGAFGNKSVKTDLLSKLVAMEKETFNASKPALSDSNGTTTSNVFSFLSDMRVEKDELEDPAASELALQNTDEKFRFDADLLAQIETNKFLDEIGFNDPTHKSFSRRDKWTKFRREAPLEPPVDSYPVINIYDGPRLNIFAAVDPSTMTTTNGSQQQVDTSQSLLPEWDAWEKQNLERLSRPLPRNGFEEMIEWTKCGKMFPYPIDNEYGYFEKFIPFHEHVFLHHTLNDERVPKSGPVFDFMNLVVLGVSKNPYMLLERKHEHIEWFKNYFKDKAAELQRMKDNEDSLTESNT